MNAGSLVGRASLLACLAAALHTAAHAEIGGMATLASQERFRGYSVSGGYPAATLSLSYDDVSGPYVEGSVMVAGNVSHGNARTRVEANAGYAFRLKSGPTIDAGIVHAEYSGYRIHGDQAIFTEVYAGVIAGLISAHLHYSPAYFERGVSTVYGDLDAALPLSSRARLTGHYGVLLQVGGPHDQSERVAQDWRVGAAADVRKLTFELAVASGSRKRGFYGPAKNGGTALLFAVSRAF